MKRTSSIINKKYNEYLIPTVLTAMATQLTAFVDSVISSNFVCPDAIAAISLVSPIQQFVFSLTVFFGLGSSALISTAQGSGDKQKANRIFTVSFVAILIVSALLMLIQLPFADSICALFTKDAELLALTHDFYVPFVIGTPFYLILFCAIHGIRIDGRPRFSSLIMIVANVINLILDYLFMAVLDMGIAGAAWATVIGNIVGLIMVATHYFSGRSSLRLDFKESSPKKLSPVLKELFSTGLSGAMGTLLIVVRLQFFISIITIIAGSQGLLAFSLCTSVSRLISMFITGASQAMIPIVALCMGERDYQGVRFAFRRAATVLAWASGIMLLYFMALPDTFIDIFGITDSADRAASRTALIINAFTIPGQAFLFLLLYYFMATGRKLIATTISIVFGVAVLPLGYIMSVPWGINGIWWSMVLVNFIGLIIVWVMALRIKKRENMGDLYLIPSSDDSELTSISIEASPANASTASVFIQNFLDSHSIEKGKATKVALAIEELIANIAEINKEKINLDIRITVSGDDVITSIRDNGKPCNPKVELNDMPRTTSLTVLCSIAKEIDYSQLLGFNRTLITI